MADTPRKPPRQPATDATAIEARLAALGVHEDDLVERFIRASGPGGQKVNKTATAVYLRHLPSGVEVKAQTARTQRANRLLARERLAGKLEARHAEQQRELEQTKARARRQKRKRPYPVKQRILAEKHKQAEKKRLRRPANRDSE